MKEVVPAPPPLVHNQFESVKELFNKYVVPTYARFDLALARGEGSYVWDVRGKRYLDLGGGIAVNCLGHANTEITQALIEQSQRLTHVSNLYYHEPQGRLAQNIVKHLAPGKVFFCNSGGEANEGLFKLARRFGHDEGRFEILTALNSFHGRTLAGLAATGQEKIKKGFGPMTPGFRHVPFNDLDAMRAAISPATVAVLIEGIHGEGGITPATKEYLLGLRALCDERKMLLMMDAVQDGHFRTGRYQAFQRILADEQRAPGTLPGSVPALMHSVENGEVPTRQDAGGTFVPDAVSMAKSLGGGFPIGALWIRDKHAELLNAGSHGTTFGGTPLACSVANRIFEVIERDRLAENAHDTGAFLKSELQALVNEFPQVLTAVRGLGFMLGVEVAAKETITAFASSEKTASIQFINRLHEAGVLAIPSGAQVVRILPPLNLSRAQAEEGLAVIRRVVKDLAGAGTI
jgi:acetylornithine/succinyldiaminopimelate/putrescine aminotransferase